METNIGQVCDRIAAELTREEFDRQALIDDATALMLVWHELRREADHLDVVHGPTSRGWAIKLAASAVEPRLRRFGWSAVAHPLPHEIWTMDRIVHLVRAALRLIERESRFGEYHDVQAADYRDSVT
jgi:hypothetical protein